MIGIDLASVDGNRVRDYKTARAAGCRFAIVRGAYVYGNKIVDDATDAIDADAIRAADMVFGAYVIVAPGPKMPTAKEQVAKFVAGSDLAPGDFPPVLDVEFPGGISRTGMSRPQLLAWVREAVEALRAAFGIAPMIYTSRRVWDGEDSDSLDADNPKVLGLGALAALELADCPLWLARYFGQYRKPAVGDDPGETKFVDALPWPPTPAAWGEGNHWIHQQQGDSLGFKGFSSTVDVNRFRVMAHGETGNRVRWAQKKLRMVEGTPGVFDAVTHESVRDYQMSQGLFPDGAIGPRTFAHLAWAR